MLTLQERAENVGWNLKVKSLGDSSGENHTTVGMIAYFVEKFADLAVCYRCSRFGHTGGRCVEEKCCNKCGGSHEARYCEEKSEWDCLNYKRLGISKGNRCHRAWGKRCPVYRKKMEIKERNTNYD